MARVDRSPEASRAEIRAILLEEALAIHAEDAAMCLAIGHAAAPLIHQADGVLTHCNAGALATGGIGTATAGMYVAPAEGHGFTVYCDETRPLLQGSRLTAWELNRAGIDAVVITDNMAAQVMREGRINMIITGADRIAANGDAANKIGTYGVAILAKGAGEPWVVALKTGGGAGGSSHGGASVAWGWAWGVGRRRVVGGVGIDVVDPNKKPAAIGTCVVVVETIDEVEGPSRGLWRPQLLPSCPPHMPEALAEV